MHTWHSLAYVLSGVAALAIAFPCAVLRLPKGKLISGHAGMSCSALQCSQQHNRRKRRFLKAGLLPARADVVLGAKMSKGNTSFR